MLFMVCFGIVLVMEEVICFFLYKSDVFGVLKKMALEMSNDVSSSRYKGALIGGMVGSIVGMIIETMILTAIVEALL